MTAAHPAPPAAMRGVLVAPGRLQGVDVARALALLGMMAAHVGGVGEGVDWGDPATWSAVVNGRSAALFAVLAGVSVGLTSGRTRPPGPPAIGRVRARLAVRAVVVVAIGLLLMALDTPVYVILPTYGALFLLVVPVLRLRARWLVVVAAVCALVSPLAALAVVPLSADADMFGIQLGLVYPVVTFLAYVLVGLAVARAGLEARRTQVALLASGTLAAVTAYVVGGLLAPVPDEAALYGFAGLPFLPEDTTPAGLVAQLFLSPRDHSSSTVDVVGTAGVAVAVIALCTLLVDGRGRAVSRVAYPLAAVGSMPLTVYAGHLVVIAALGELPASGTAWALFAIGSVLVAVVWRAFLGRGPLERLVARLTGLVPAGR
ncbi:heparan-alpha-glucosaminide N-acetyltransferase domain-containing protein [Curtobacterium sp. MCBA15_012]|uniref:heparan-alpha-glucosaminide N-acetyltransferase domain-containing protein n=1 Tax=Curtobacterium sp. MCBA15_012 TaxID=1898738 RepID=UPI0009F5939F|nr:heparan-alpha-glucosaminide N-acetyltransferase domain-containing protein [Curtobacterium sp. MCBA15_012]WIA99136.1 heparan-alpha-glucosaminide N-acetyltransferase domain-containing protein [Curtobacterium sp. MCBA15_012]